MRDLKEVTPSIFATSTGVFAGKTTFCLGLALKLLDEGHAVGYFKPLGHVELGAGEPYVDEDVMAFKDTLGLEEDEKTISPLSMSSKFLDHYTRVQMESLRKVVMDAYREVRKGKDFVVIEGLHGFKTGTLLGLDCPTLSELLETKIIVVSTARDDFALDEILEVKDSVSRREAQLPGVVLNSVPRLMVDRAHKAWLPELQSQGLKVFGIIPEDKNLAAPTVRDVIERLGGRLLVEASMDRPVENVLVGAMTYESALRYFRKARNKAVITGGDRADIVLAALETDTSVIVLTGDMRPSSKIMDAATSRDVGVCVVPTDTYTAVTQLEAITGRIKPGDTRRAGLAKKAIESHVDWRALTEVAGLPKPSV
ncbi:MAG: DRTGG domain-containing protein [Aigarchaeota archaeon]|nr:DRTGG domain-containing protein [Aigarchaeota archaeon]